MDEFGVKYFNTDDTEHLLEYLKKHYAIWKYWEGRNYPGLTVDWNYKDDYVDLSMPEYVKKRVIGSNIPNQKDNNMPNISMEKYSIWHHIQMR